MHYLFTFIILIDFIYYLCESIKTRRYEYKKVSLGNKSRIRAILL